MFHAVRALARLSGLPLRPVSAGSAVQGLAAGAPAEAVIANLAAEQQVVEVPFEASVALLSADDVPAAAIDAAFLDRLMTLSGRDTPGTASLLPETHIAVVRTSRIVRGMEEAWQLARTELRELPRSVNFISGPSRTADIEMSLTIGMHGPGEVHVFLVDE